MLGMRVGLWAGVAAFFLFLVVDWATSVTIPSKCEQYDSNPREHSEPKQCASLRSTVFEGTEPVVYLTARWFDVHNGAITGIATVFLAVITAGLVSIARDQFKTTRAQLRAYIWTESPNTNIDGAPNAAKMAIKNSGQTPAYKVCFWSRLKVYDIPIRVGLLREREWEWRNIKRYRPVETTLNIGHGNHPDKHGLNYIRQLVLHNAG
jgi:hypothetical protein